MTTILTNYTVTAVCEVTSSIVVQDCKTWKQAAFLAAKELQNDVEINHDGTVTDFEIDWRKITEDQCEDYGDGEQQVTQIAELSMCVEVTASDWKSAATKALEIAQDNVEIVSSDDVAIDWQRITEDMVDQFGKPEYVLKLLTDFVDAIAAYNKS